MKFTYPTSRPYKFHRETIYRIGTRYGLETPSTTRRTYIGTGAVLFRFSGFNDPVRVVIDLRQTGGVEPLADGEIVAPARGGDRFALFEEFPAGYLHKSRQCYFEVWLLNLTPGQPDASTSVQMEVLYRTK